MFTILMYVLECTIFISCMCFIVSYFVMISLSYVILKFTLSVWVIFNLVKTSCKPMNISFTNRLHQIAFINS